ncbi:hypothetical protein DLD77_00925 [Chitinophaga alhagiae]|uniref:Uncharacterized protein n=1 Tax=Chitinophaga alhagiae TaxID=2203219 RepID=A0ABM6W8W1_9BACT|nr:FecR family protein [Chitinophaga alhagiae]AWO00369.1 hypothetical protein DLD77_00925 [Chitinophaga alhagiae]
MNEQTILRYLQGACSADEKSQFEDWLAASAENRQQYYELRLIWHASQIEHFRSKEQLDKALATFTGNVRQERRKIYLRIVRYAAIFIGVVAIAGMYLLVNKRPAATQEMLTAYVLQTDSSKLVVLDDGTRVWLNNNSRLTYPKQFSGKERTVTLEGEAFFDVSPRPEQPFIVEAATIRVNVLGTSFNLRAYGPAHNAPRSMEAVLVSGKIAIADHLGEHLATLTPGQMASFVKNSHYLSVKNVNTAAYTSWRNGQIMLTAVNLPAITRKLTELYGVNFSVDPAIKDTTLYTFSFSKTKPIEEVMEMLGFIAPVSYKVQGKNIQLIRK